MDMKMSDYLRNLILMEGAKKALADIVLRVHIGKPHTVRGYEYVPVTLQICNVHKHSEVLIEAQPVDASLNGGTVTWCELHNAFTISLN